MQRGIQSTSTRWSSLSSRPRASQWRQCCAAPQHSETYGDTLLCKESWLSSHYVLKYSSQNQENQRLLLSTHITANFVIINTIFWLSTMWRTFKIKPVYFVRGKDFTVKRIKQLRLRHSLHPAPRTDWGKRTISDSMCPLGTHKYQVRSLQEK